MELQKKTTIKSKVWEWFKFTIEVLIICFILNSSIGFIKIIGHSMDPTLKDTSLIFVNKIPIYFKSPKHGDVIIIRQQGIGYNIVKRIIGIPGDRVLIKDGIVYVNQNPLLEIYSMGKPMDMKEVTVEPEKIFVLGDNREPGESLDSRSSEIGQLPISTIKGYAVISVFPLYKIMKPLKI